MGGRGAGAARNKEQSSLTNEEKKALQQYRGSYYSPMNADLRGGYELSKAGKQRVELLDQAIEKQVLSSPMFVYRGVSGDIFGVNRNIDENDIQSFVGKTIWDKAYMSTSFSKQDAFHDDILLSIAVPKGSGVGIDVNSHLPAQAGSAGEREREYLIARGQGLRIISFKKLSDGRFEVNAELVRRRR